MKQRIIFDLDGTLCSHERDYNNAIPFFDRIKKVNQLFEEGNIIIIDTARGSTTGIDWYTITLKQLNSWGVKFHDLRVGEKLNYDLLIDDKAINSNLYFNVE